VGSSAVAPDLETCSRVLAWYDCQDVDHSGLISMQESTDWQDLFCTRGKGLYLNCLYVLALESTARLARAAARPELSSRYGLRAADVRANINAYHWYSGDGQMLRHIAHTFSSESKEAQDSLGRKRYLPKKRLLLEEQYYLPYLGFRAVGEWFDSLGHMMAILAGVADDAKTSRILEFVNRFHVADLPMCALCPAVKKGDPDWRDYYGMLNLPDHYHNGGVWPFIGGFYIAALVRLGYMEKAADALVRLAELNETGEFNEWHHGATGEPMGVHDQAWSAGMYIYAYECVRKKTPVYFENA
jgi:glycogen debranching enzyme